MFVGLGEIAVHYFLVLIEIAFKTIQSGIACLASKTIIKKIVMFF